VNCPISASRGRISPASPGKLSHRSLRQRLVARPLDLVAQRADDSINGIAHRKVTLAVEMILDLGAADDLTLAVGEIFQEGIFALRERDFLIAA
jgi:hypothetical protein